MNEALRAVLAVLLTLSCAPAFATPEQPAPAFQAVVTYDAASLARDADRPPLLVRVTMPAKPEGKLPVVVLSHGAGLSRMNYDQLADWWARHGLIVLRPDHPGASVDGFAAASPPDVARERIIDMRRVADGLDEIAQQVPGLEGHIDEGKLIAAGHSFGGHTVSAVVGAKIMNPATGKMESFDDPRYLGAVLLSPPGAGGDQLSEDWQTKGGYLTVDWQDLRGPALVIVGTKDDSKVMTWREADWHADIYNRSTAKNWCLITMPGAAHYLGGIVDPRRDGVPDADPARLALVREATLAAFRAILDGTALHPALTGIVGDKAELQCR